MSLFFGHGGCNNDLFMAYMCQYIPIPTSVHPPPPICRKIIIEQGEGKVIKKAHNTGGLLLSANLRGRKENRAHFSLLPRRVVRNRAHLCKLP
jgi:hypothetical protein